MKVLFFAPIPPPFNGATYMIKTLLESKLKEHFDVVTCFDVLEHVDNLDYVLNSLKFLMHKNSILTVSVPVYDSLFGKIVGILDKDETHLVKQSRYFWLQKLQQHGYNILSVKGLFRNLFFSRYYISFFNKSCWKISPAIYLVARPQF